MSFIAVKKYHFDLHSWEGIVNLNRPWKLCNELSLAYNEPTNLESVQCIILYVHAYTVLSRMSMQFILYL